MKKVVGRPLLSQNGIFWPKMDKFGQKNILKFEIQSFKKWVFQGTQRLPFFLIVIKKCPILGTFRTILVKFDRFLAIFWPKNGQKLRKTFSKNWGSQSAERLPFLQIGFCNMAKKRQILPNFYYIWGRERGRVGCATTP